MHGAQCPCSPVVAPNKGRWPPRHPRGTCTPPSTRGTEGTVGTAHKISAATGLEKAHANTCTRPGDADKTRDSTKHLADKQLLGRNAHDRAIATLGGIRKLHNHGLRPTQVLSTILILDGHLRLRPGGVQDHGAALAPALLASDNLAAADVAILPKERLHVLGGGLKRDLASCAFWEVERGVGHAAATVSCAPSREQSKGTPRLTEHLRLRAHRGRAPVPLLLPLLLLLWEGHGFPSELRKNFRSEASDAAGPSSATEVGAEPCGAAEQRECWLC